MMDVVEGGMPKPFAITFVTSDEKRKSGGELIRVKERSATKYRDFVPGDERDFTGKGKAAFSKNPNHGVHATRNINIPGIAHIVKIHIRLITSFNGKKVYW